VLANTGENPIWSTVLCAGVIVVVVVVVVVVAVVPVVADVLDVCRSTSWECRWSVVFE